MLSRLHMGTLEPRWGGSYAEMREFADAIASDSAVNPRLVTLRGAVLQDEARELSLAATTLEPWTVSPKPWPSARTPYSRTIEASPTTGRETTRARFSTCAVPCWPRPQDSETLRYYGLTLGDLAYGAPRTPRGIDPGPRDRSAQSRPLARSGRLRRRQEPAVGEADETTLPNARAAMPVNVSVSRRAAEDHPLSCMAPTAASLRSQRAQRIDSGRSFCRQQARHQSG